MLKLDRRIVRRAVAPFTALLALMSGSVAFVQDVSGFQRLVCKAPGVSGVCASEGWGGVPSAEQDRVWAAATARTDGEGLRAYLRRFPRGAYAEEAQARLAGCRTGEAEVWVKEDKRLPLYIGFSANPSASEAAARADALARGERSGQGLCVAYSTGEFRLAAAQPAPKTWKCEGGPAGRNCGFEGEVVCHVEARRIDVREICKP
jgi:hypothetical protein